MTNGVNAFKMSSSLKIKVVSIKKVWEVRGFRDDFNRIPDPQFYLVANVHTKFPYKG